MFLIHVSPEAEPLWRMPHKPHLPFLWEHFLTQPEKDEGTFSALLLFQRCETGHFGQTIPGGSESQVNKVLHAGHEGSV